MQMQTLLKSKMKQNVPQLRSGQVVRVHEKIKEGNKERMQVFEGLVISVKHGGGLNGTFVVRKIASGGVGVERTFPLHMPSIEKIEILRQERVRRAKLYYVRGQVGKKTKRRKAKLENLIFDMGGRRAELVEGGEEEGPADAEAQQAYGEAREPVQNPEGIEESFSRPFETGKSQSEGLDEEKKEIEKKSEKEDEKKVSENK
jgi:large subunit ribosomal protein L19